jgi:hypothetical protein
LILVLVLRLLKGFSFGITANSSFFFLDFLAGSSVNAYTKTSIALTLLGSTSLLSPTFSSYAFYITGGLVSLTSLIAFAVMHTRDAIKADQRTNLSIPYKVFAQRRSIITLMALLVMQINLTAYEVSIPMIIQCFGVLVSAQII